MDARERDGERPELAVATAADMVAGHVALDISCVDRLYLNGYIARLQAPGGIIYFFHEHRGRKIVSPALFEPIGEKGKAESDRRARSDNTQPARPSPAPGFLPGTRAQGDNDDTGSTRQPCRTAAAGARQNGEAAGHRCPRPGTLDKRRGHGDAGSTTR